MTTFGQRECDEEHRTMIEKTKKGYVRILTASVAEVFSKEPYLSKIRAVEERQIDTILRMIKLTPGDLAYLKRHDVLYVTLTSAYPLSKELVDRVDKATAELLATVNGKTSLWVKEDPSFIGGLRLRIGDTVYDGTVVEQLL